MASLQCTSDEVAAALAAGRAVVAVESAMLAHGVGSSAGIELAARLHDIVRSHGAVPALIGVDAGVIRIGMTVAAAEAVIGRPGVTALARRDLAAAVLRGETGVATASATMACAHLAGIAVVATGGIGGVHRGHAETLDVSADLDTLATLPVAVVAAGAKAILDLPATLEWLETRSVPVVGYGTDSFPPYYAAASDLPLALRVDDPDAAARLIAAHRRVGGAGVLIANPIPAAHALDVAMIEEAITLAVAEAWRDGLSGKAVTPRLMARLAALTSGGSQAATQAIAEHNAALAARIAAALATTG